MESQDILDIQDVEHDSINGYHEEAETTIAAGDAGIETIQTLADRAMEEEEQQEEKKALAAAKRKQEEAEARALQQQQQYQSEEREATAAAAVNGDDDPESDDAPEPDYAGLRAALDYYDSQRLILDTLMANPEPAFIKVRYLRYKEKLEGQRAVVKQAFLRVLGEAKTHIDERDPVFVQPEERAIAELRKFAGFEPPALPEELYVDVWRH